TYAIHLRRCCPRIFQTTGSTATVWTGDAFRGWVNVQQAKAVGQATGPRLLPLGASHLSRALNTSFASVVPVTMAVAAVVPVTMSWGARVGLEDFVRVGRGAETGETAADHVDPIAVGIDARFPPAGWNRGGRGPRVAFDVVHLIGIQWRTSSPAADGVYLIAQVACHKAGPRGWHGRLGRPGIILRVVDHDVVQELSTRTAPDNVNLASVLHRGCVRAGPWQRGHRAPAIRMDVLALHHIQRVSAAGAST